MKTKLLALLILLLFSFGGAFAQTQISGVQTGTLGPGTYEVVGDIRVPPGQTLTIEPGTEFLHSGHYTWQIQGSFVAQGVEGDSIMFVRQNAEEDHKWGGLRFDQSATGSLIDYCVVEYAKNPMVPYLIYGAGIYLNGIAIDITNSRISYCSAYWDGAGVYASNVTGMTIDNCIVNNNEAPSGANGGGILFDSCNDCSVTNSMVFRNSATGT